MSDAFKDAGPGERSVYDRTGLPKVAAIAKLGAGDGLVERAEAALEGVTDGPWLYRPDKYDDWGVVKADDFHLCQVRDPNCYMPEQLNEARAAKIDPWEANARFLAFARQWVPEAAAHIAALTAERDDLIIQDAEATRLMIGAQRRTRQYKARAEAAEAERDALRAKVARLEGAGDDHNDLLRSALSIAKREGVDGEVASTNWDAYYNRVAVVLKRYHQTANEARAAITDGGKDG